MAIFRLNYLNQVQIAANTLSRNRTKAIIQRFPTSAIGIVEEDIFGPTFSIDIETE